MRPRSILISLGMASLSLLAAAGEPETTPSGNLILNGSFETRSGPRKPYPNEPWGYGHLDTLARSPFAQWGYSGFFDGGQYDIKLGKGHTGNTAARLVCRKRGRGGICTDAIRVKPGTTVRFRGSFKAIGAAGECWINFEGDPGDGWATIALPRRADYDWTEVTADVVVKEPRNKKKYPVSDDGTIAIHVFVYMKAYGELWIDDVSLVPVKDAP